MFLSILYLLLWDSMSKGSKMVSACTVSRSENPRMRVDGPSSFSNMTAVRTGTVHS